jgi:hypothetical protein
MIITKNIEKIVTQYNIRIFKKFGFLIGDIAIVDIKDWDRNSHEKVLVKCDICGIEKYNQYRQYMDSYEKYNLYSCSSKCSNFKNKKTCLEKYGNENYHNSNKCKKTCLEKYGVDNTFKSREIIDKIDFIKRERYGDKLEIIVDKMKDTMIERYGVDNISKLEEVKDTKKQTCFNNYGVTHPMYSEEILNKLKETNIKNGNWYKETNDEYKLYRKMVDNLTRKNIKILLENWDGNDYYDNEYILPYYKLDYNNRLYPTIDHKISVKNGFLSNISIEEISSMDNLCLTKRGINSQKNSKNEYQFKNNNLLIFNYSSTFNPSTLQIAKSPSILKYKSLIS